MPICQHLHKSTGRIILFFLCIGIACEGEMPCERGFPQPVLEFQGIEKEAGEIYYKLAVQNFFEYPNDEFQSGLFRASIWNEKDQVLTEEIILSDKVDLIRLGYTLPVSDTATQQVYIKLTHTGCDQEYVSEKIDVFCLWGPMPELVFQGTAMDTNQIDGQVFQVYKLGLNNWEAFPDRLFAQAPELASCGANVLSARTWLKILDEGDQHLYGYCGYGSAAFLESFLFRISINERAPSQVYIRLTDRKCEQILTSNRLDL